MSAGTRGGTVEGAAQVVVARSAVRGFPSSAVRAGTQGLLGSLAPSALRRFGGGSLMVFGGGSLMVFAATE
jgi:hypothetical protein